MRVVTKLVLSFYFPGKYSVIARFEIVCNKKQLIKTSFVSSANRQLLNTRPAATAITASFALWAADFRVPKSVI
jgi:hypothetical protein